MFTGITKSSVVCSQIEGFTKFPLDIIKNKEIFLVSLAGFRNPAPDFPPSGILLLCSYIHLESTSSSEYSK